MENIELTPRELHVLKTLVLLRQEQTASDKHLDVDMKVLYGKLNVLWSEARKAERQNS